MKKILFPAACVALISWNPRTLPNRCNCKPVDHPYRADLKHNIKPQGLAERKSVIGVETIRSWEQRYTIPLIIDKGRVHGTPEDTIYNLEGWIYAIKTDKADCDLHVQVGPRNPRWPRVVIEIPPEECAMQDSLIAQFVRKGFKLDAQNEKGAHFIARGPAFYDGNNRGRPGKKHTEGCSWEIHPVLSINLK